jgi:hypothetical protein
MKQSVQPSAVEKVSRQASRLPQQRQQNASHAGRLAQLAAMVNGSPLVRRQLKQRDEMQRKPLAALAQLTQAGFSSVPSPQVAQLALDAENVQEKATQFLAAHDKESVLIGQANLLLKNYSEDATPANLKKLNDALPGIRDDINKLTDAQAAIVAEYAGCGVAGVRKTFLDAVLKKDSTELGPLFNKLIAQTSLAPERDQPEDAEEVVHVDEKFKYRFLSYVLQSSKYAAGEGRFRELMGLLGERQVVIDKLALSAPKAGLADPDTDNPKSEKRDARDKGADKRLLEDKGGNLAEFVKAKQQARRDAGDTRDVNPARTEIRNVTVFMDSSQKLLPVYYGLTGQKEIQAFTSQQFTAVHHELGHMVNALKGQHGKKADKYGPTEGALGKLTDEEELQNISLDQFSDKAFTDELGLPERIAHHGYTELNKAVTEFSGDFGTELSDWDKLTYKLDARRVNILGRIKALTAKNWGAYTSGRSKPDGVIEIGNVLVTLKTTRKDVKAQLGLVKEKAAGAQARPSSRRTDPTKEFYAMGAGMKFESVEDLNATDAAITKFQGERFP